METGIRIIKDILSNSIPPKYLGKVNWEGMLNGFLVYDSDQKPLYTEVYKLELNDPEKLISQLPKLYKSFIEEVAEDYVLGNVSKKASEILTQNQDFVKRVHYLKTLKNVITKVERKRVKEELPLAYQRITFQPNEKDIKNAVKQKAREDLKEKLKTWNQEAKKDVVLEKRVEPAIEMSTESKKETKVISLTWIKYAVAACVVLAAGVLYFNSYNSLQPTEDNVVDTDKEENIDEIQLAEIEITSDNIQVLTPIGLGYVDASTKVKMTINFIDQSKQKESIEASLKEGISKSDYYESLLDTLNKKENKYTFTNNELSFYSKKIQENYKFIQFDKELYLSRDDKFYQIKETKVPADLTEVQDSEIIEQLERIIFDNE